MGHAAKTASAQAGFLAAGWSDSAHGDCCDCVALARAVGAGREAVDLNYCRAVLQKHWRLKCNHRRRGAGD